MTNRSLPEMPCGPILELHGQRKRFHIPFGLKALLEEMTKEVLRSQPENIYDFLAVFMESRLRKRREAEERAKDRKSWQQHRWSWQGKSILNPEELKEMLEEFHTPLEEANHHAVVIQAAFRGHMARKKVKDLRKSMMHPDDVDGRKSGVQHVHVRTSESHARKSWKVKNWDGQHNRTSILPPEDLKEFLEELDQHGVPLDKVEEKAVVIQAAFRGYQARKKVNEMKKSVVTEDVRHEMQKAAATAEPTTTAEEDQPSTTITGTEDSTVPVTTTASESATEEPPTVSESQPSQTITHEATPSVEEPQGAGHPPVEEAPIEGGNHESGAAPEPSSSDVQPPAEGGDVPPTAQEETPPA